MTHKATEVSTLQTRLITTEEQLADLKKHLEVVKDANSAKEQQINLAQADVSQFFYCTEITLVSFSIAQKLPIRTYHRRYVLEVAS